jgi:hypothetical protein
VNRAIVAGEFALEFRHLDREFVAFVLLSIPALANPKHHDRTEPLMAAADLLWFPTGGGKTEAYLGVAAFTMAIRRLQNDLGGYDSSRGLAVIMRYTLRLLTIQQFQRATTLLCAMETLRKADRGKSNKSPANPRECLVNLIEGGRAGPSARFGLRAQSFGSVGPVIAHQIVWLISLALSHAASASLPFAACIPVLPCCAAHFAVCSLSIAWATARMSVGHGQRCATSRMNSICWMVMAHHSVVVCLNLVRVGDHSTAQDTQFAVCSGGAGCIGHSGRAGVHGKPANGVRL